jgi:uncharacterized protein DUF5050
MILGALFLGCETRSLSYVVVDGRDAGAGNGGNAGGAGTGGDGGGAGSGGAAGGTTGTGGTTGGAGTTGSAGAAGSSADRCTISCGAGPCPSLALQPRVLVTSPFDQQLGAIAVSADTLYWGTLPSSSPGEIRSMPLAGGPSTLLAQNVIVGELFLDGSTLYYVTNDRRGGYSLFSVPTTGGTSRMVATGSEIWYLTSDASSIYFGQKTATGATSSRIMRVDRATSGVTPLVEIPGALWGFAIDGTNVYWAWYSNGGTLSRRSLAGGDTTTLRTSTAPITFPVIDGDDIDFVEGINTPDVCQSAIWSVPKGGGTPRLLTPGTSGIDAGRLARDATHLYWGRGSHQGAVLRTVKGQTPEILAVDQANVSWVIAVGPTDVYWIASSGSGYEVRTVPK